MPHFEFVFHHLLKYTEYLATMKMYIGFLALCAGASAFVAPAAFSSSPSVALKSSTRSNIAIDKYVPEQGASYGDMPSEDTIFAGNIESLQPVRVQGGALRTWSFKNVERLLVAITGDDITLLSSDSVMRKEGRLLNCQIDLCQGPDNTPLRMEVKSGKGKLRPFKAVIENPGGDSTLFIRNIGDLEFPVVASVGGANERGTSGLIPISESIYDMPTEKLLQGGAIITYPLDASVISARVILKTDGRPLNALVELVQGPNSVKHTIDLYTEDGLERPLFTVISTPGSGNVIRIVNTASLEFPLVVNVVPYEIEVE